MRIVFVTHQYPPNYNTGTELYAHRLALKIRGTLGHDVRVYTFEPGYQSDQASLRREETVHDGVPVTRVYMWAGLTPNHSLSQFYNVMMGKQFRRYLQEVAPDVVHVFHASFHGATIIEAVPAGKYKLAAWHEELKDAKPMDVEVKAGQTVEVTLSF